MKNNTSNSFLLITAVLLLPLFTQGQTTINSPYSRFGLGRLSPNSSQMNMAMGGTSAATRSSLFINPANPASYSAFDSTSFIFEGAFLGNTLKLSTLNASAKNKDAALGYVTMGFPVAKWWKASFGVMPYTSVGYLVSYDSAITNLGNVRYGYNGSGGLNKAYIGNAFEPFKNFSAGFNLSYIFGTINHESTITYPDSSNHYSARTTNSTELRNLNLDLGLQYHTTLKSGTFLVAGLTVSPQQKLKGSADQLAVSYVHNYSSNIDIYKDTALDVSRAKGDVTLPLNLGLGLSLGRLNRWTASGDVQWQKWEDYTFYGLSDSLRNSLRISLGGQFRPSPIDIGKYWKRITYRAGFRYEMSALELRNTRLNEIGISFGMGLPMKKTRSTVNLALEAGTFGTTNNNLVKETYLRLSVGVSLYEKWFLKRKYE